MSVTAEVLPNHAVAVEADDLLAQRSLALVQDNLIISTFPGNQADAAVGLARVLCRALALPVDVFRFHRGANECVLAGAIADTKRPEWVHVAHVHSTFLMGVKVDLYDPDLREAATAEHAAP